MTYCTFLNAEHNRNHHPMGDRACCDQDVPDLAVSAPIHNHKNEDGDLCPDTIDNRVVAFDNPRGIPTLSTFRVQLKQIHRRDLRRCPRSLPRRRHPQSPFRLRSARDPDSNCLEPSTTITKSNCACRVTVYWFTVSRLPPFPSE